MELKCPDDTFLHGQNGLNPRILRIRIKREIIKPVLTQISLMDFSILIYRVNPFVMQGVSGVFCFSFLFYFLIEISVSKQ